MPAENSQQKYDPAQFSDFIGATFQVMPFLEKGQQCLTYYRLLYKLDGAGQLSGGPQVKDIPGARLCNVEIKLLTGLNEVNFWPFVHYAKRGDHSKLVELVKNAGAIPEKGKYLAGVLEGELPVEEVSPDDHFYSRAFITNQIIEVIPKKAHKRN